VRDVDLTLMLLCIDRLKKECKEKYNVANVREEHYSSSCYTKLDGNRRMPMKPRIQQAL
jgi:hypothetical protein